MIKINLFRPIGSPSTTPPRATLPPEGSPLREALKRFIQYRNYKTGAGIFRTGLKFVGDHSKLRTNTRSHLSGSFFDIKRCFWKMMEEETILNQALKEKILKAEKNWRAIEKESIFPLHRTVNEKAKEYGQERGGPLLPILLPYETEILMYLRLIDAEIDSILKIFGLTKNSKI